MECKKFNFADGVVYVKQHEEMTLFGDFFGKVILTCKNGEVQFRKEDGEKIKNISTSIVWSNYTKVSFEALCFYSQLSGNYRVSICCGNDNTERKDIANSLEKKEFNNLRDLLKSINNLSTKYIGILLDGPFYIYKEERGDR